MPCVYLPGPAPAVTVANSKYASCHTFLSSNLPIPALVMRKAGHNWWVAVISLPPIVFCTTENLGWNFI